MLQTLGAIFGAQDIEVGDNAFDRFIIKGEDPNRVNDILSSEARDELLQLDARVDELSVTDLGIRVVINRIVDDLEELGALLDTTIGAANHMVAFRRPVSQGPFR